MKIKKRKLALFVSILLVILCGLLSKTYRPYIYQNHIYDYHFADTLTSWFCIPSAALFFWGISKDKFRNCFMGSLLGSILFEFVFTLTFDWYDIITLLLSGGITYLIYIFYKRTKDRTLRSGDL